MRSWRADSRSCNNGPEHCGDTCYHLECGNAETSGTLKVALDSDIIGIDPHGLSAGVDRNVYTSIYNGHVAPDKNLNIVPDLTESWSTPDPRTYVFKLRPNVKFHDGTACDADAVKKSFDWILDPANASARRPEIVDIDQISVVDPLTVKIARARCHGVAGPSRHLSRQSDATWRLRDRSCRRAASRVDSVWSSRPRAVVRFKRNHAAGAGAAE